MTIDTSIAPVSMFAIIAFGVLGGLPHGTSSTARRSRGLCHVRNNPCDHLCQRRRAGLKHCATSKIVARCLCPCRVGFARGAQPSHERRRWSKTHSQRKLHIGGRLSELAAGIAPFDR